jgi:hypothetical protein
VLTRYQGSAYNRHNGNEIDNWSYEGPDQGEPTNTIMSLTFCFETGPDPLQAMSWEITLPRWESIDGKSEIVLNKMQQGCGFFTSPIVFETARAMGIPATTVSFARLHINGGYYHYVSATCDCNYSHNSDHGHQKT